jgi:lectin, mannose-binding 1
MRFVPGLGFALGMLRHTSGYTANPEQVQENLSFGHHGEIWTADHRHVSGFQLSGEHGHLPEIHSDRIIMTPPWPGNKRSALWADNSELDDQWSVEMEFRVTGPDRGSGNMQLWYVKDQHEVGTSSLYTVGKWDGLGIIIDQYGGHGGTIRGFLNDHQVSYKDHHHVDQLSFASCDFSFRNLGRFVHLEVKQTRDSFEVNVDHHQCFKTHKVRKANPTPFPIC